MERYMNKVALVSGAGSGIGKSTVIELVNNGMKVAGIDLKADNLQELESKLNNIKGVFKGIKCDVINPDEVKKAFKWIEENWGGISVVVNCAGIMEMAPFTDCNIEKFRRTLDINVLGLTALNSGSIKSMVDHNIDGHIINICSITGHSILNQLGIGPYSVSKHGVKMVSGYLRRELISTAQQKIRVTNISPGVVKTELSSIFWKTGKKNGQDIPILNPKDISDCIKFVLAVPSHVNITELTVQPTGERA